MAVVAQRCDRDREQDRLADGRDFGVEALLLSLSPEGGEVGRDRYAGYDFAVGAFEGVDLGAEVVAEILVAAGIGEGVALLRQHRREADYRIAPGVAVAVVGIETADRFVGVELAPHVGEDGDDVFQAPEEMIRIIKWLPRAWVAGVTLLADEVGLPGCHRRDDWDFFGLAGGGDRVGGFRSRGDQHQVNFVFDYELLGDLGGAVGVRLAVFDDDAEIAASGLQEAIDDELIGFGKGRERARLRANVAKLYFGAARDGRGGKAASRERDASGG